MVETKKRGRPKINKGYTHIKVDIDTYNRLKKLAGNVKLGTFLRHFTKAASGISSIDGISESEIAVYKTAAELQERQSWNVITMDDKDGDKVGSYDRGLSMIDSMMIDAALEKDPDVQQVGFYDRQADDTWLFNEKRYEEALKLDEADRKRKQ